MTDPKTGTALMFGGRTTRTVSFRMTCVRSELTVATLGGTPSCGRTTPLYVPGTFTPSEKLGRKRPSSATYSTWAAPKISGDVFAPEGTAVKGTKPGTLKRMKSIDWRNP